MQLKITFSPSATDLHVTSFYLFVDGEMQELFVVLVSVFIYCATFGCISAPFLCLNSKEPEGSSFQYCSLPPQLLNCPTIPEKVVLTPDPFCFS